jgi:cell division septation protein DedD
MAMATSQDTEITLGTGRVLGLFFGLVVLCAIFFGMGFSLGKNSTKAQADDSPASSPVASRDGKRPSAVAAPTESKQSQDMTFYKSVGQKSTDSELSSTATAGTSPETGSPQADPNAKTADATASATPLNGYYVQVAAVSKQEDADALVDALKKKQYPAQATQTGSDKLFHVQVGPFAAIKDAEAMRTQLLSDGYNPILKK